MLDTAPPPASLDSFLAGVERRAFRRARLATRDPDEALDLVQDAMLRLARSYATRPAAEWPALFQRILVNRIRDWQRRQVLRRRLLFWRPESDGDEDLFEGIADHAAAEGAAALAGEQLSRRVEVALAALPARQREALELRVWEGMDVEQTAAAMGCSAGSVKTHLSRALAALRSKLDGAQDG